MRRFVITGPNGQPGVGSEFEVDDEATDVEIALAAADAVAEYLSYGWEEIAATEE